MSIVLAKVHRLLERVDYAERYKGFRAKYIIDASFVFRGIGCNLFGDGQIVLGKRSYMGNWCAIGTEKGFNVYVGDDCSLSHYVSIYSSSRDRKGHVFIGNDVRLDRHVFINPSVTIKDHSHVAANAVVKRGTIIGEHELWGGVPAVYKGRDKR